MTQTIGILSDTHLMRADTSFIRTAATVFSSCSIIVHAGDICELAVLDAFSDKVVYAVQGNMCSPEVRGKLPESLIFSVGNYSFAVCHGSGNKQTIMERLYSRFPLADCIIYGHTHQASIERIGATILVNPGSFQQTGPYGSPGSYAILSVSSEGLRSHIHSLSQLA